MGVLNMPGMLLTLLATLASVHGEKSLMIENTSYVNLMENGKLMASKQKNMSIDLNTLTAVPKMLMEANATGTVKEVNINAQTFTFGDEASETTGGVASKMVKGTATADGVSLELTVYMFTADGNHTLNGEVTMVMEGDVKVMLKLTEYTFNENSTMLNMTFTAEGSGSPTANNNDKTTDGMTYDLGGNGKLILSKKQMVGAVYKDVMPTVNTKTVSVMFNKTDSAANLVYSFILKPADVKISEGTPNSCGRLSPLGVLALLVATLRVLLW